VTITADEVRTSLNKALGKEVLHKASDSRYVVKYIATGLLPVDIIFNGGIPRGRFISIQGDWSTLKSYIGYYAIKAVQQMGGIAALIDTEHSFDPEWATEIGIDLDQLIIERPDNGEEAIDVAEGLVRSKVDLIVFDSITAATPQGEQDKRLFKENVQPGRLAALMSIALRKLTTANEQTAIIWINQLRENIGITFGPREKATGGRAVPFYMSMMLDIRKVGKITKDEQMYTGEKWQNHKVQIGQKYKMELIKSKLSKPFAEIWFDWSLTDGAMDLTAFVVNQAVQLGIITIKGNTWTYGSTKAVGRANFRKKVDRSPEVQKALETAVRHAHGLPALTSVAKKRRINPPSKKKALVRR
jgi:recombination protein RecA